MDNQKTNNKTLILTIGIILTILIVGGGTLAYWSWTTNESERTNIVFTLEQDFACAVDGGGDITETDAFIVPTTCTNSEHAIMREVTVTPSIYRDGLTIDMDLWIEVKSLDTGLKNSDNFKYAFTTSSTSCDTDVVATGNLKGLTTGSQVPILGKSFSSSTPETYYLWIWLDVAETSSDTMDQTFSLTLGGECTDAHEFVVPEGATYETGESTGSCGWGSSYAVVYEAGDIIDFEPSTCDRYTYGDYTYYYNADVRGLVLEENTSLNGWGVVHNGSVNPGAILTSINGKDVVSLYETFVNSTIETAPVIPSTIKYMNNAFNNCTSLTGIIEINANPTEYSNAFYATTQPITLTGSSTMLNELAATADNGNVIVADPEGQLSGVWIFDEDPNISLTDTYDIQFTSNNAEFTKMTVLEGGIEINYENSDGLTNVYLVVGGDGWVDDAYRTVDFGTSQVVDVDFWNWFTSNATKIAN